MISSETENNFDIMPLYKYQSCPENDSAKMDWVRQLLVNHTLYFSSRKLFNDPFDCVVPCFQQIPGTIIKRFSEEFVDLKFKDTSEVEKENLITELMSVKALEDIRNLLQDEVDKAGIVCFSQVRDDILMWAHYADKHKGVCFEFDGSDNCLFFGEAQPVEYKSFTQIPLDKNRERQMTRVILTKSKHWMYEKEYRIFRPVNAGSQLDYPVELLTGIIFGCMMPNKVRETIRQWVEEGNCRVAYFEARPRVADYALDIVRID